jgi:hypothetical protein
MMRVIVMTLTMGLFVMTLMLSVCDDEDDECL